MSHPAIRTSTASAGTCANLIGDATRSSHSAGSCPVCDASGASRTRFIRTRQRLQQPVLPPPWAACWPSSGIAGKPYGLPSRGRRSRHVLLYESWPSTDGLWISRASGSHRPVVIGEFSVTNSCSHRVRPVDRLVPRRFFRRSLRTSAQLTARFRCFTKIQYFVRRF